MVNILLILFPSQLFEEKYIEKIFLQIDNEKIDNKHIILWEHPYFFQKFPYHKFKLIFHRATMKNYFDNLSKKYKKHYIEYSEENKIKSIIKSESINQIRFFNPIEKEIINLLDTNKIISNNTVESKIYPSPYFLNSTNWDKNEKIKSELNALRHDLFYKKQRIQYNVMVKKHNDK